MRKVLKVTAWTVTVVLILTAGFGFYVYQTNPTIKAIINNDESKLYYFPVKELDDLSAFSYEETPLAIDDSISIYAYNFAAETEETIGRIFLIHGSGGNASRYQNQIAPLVKSGFQVYTFDWRGFGKSTGTPLHKNVLADSKLAFRDFIARTQPDSLPTVIYGMSVGGQVAINIAKENEDLVDALVLDGSIESFQTLTMDMAPAEFLKENAKNNPQDFDPGYVAIEDIRDVQHTPKLIIHSSDDRIVPIIRGQNLFDQAQEPKTFWETEGQHIMTLKNYPEETVAKIKELLSLDDSTIQNM